MWKWILILGGIYASLAAARPHHATQPNLGRHSLMTGDPTQQLPPWMLPERPWYRKIWPFGTSEPLQPVYITPITHTTDMNNITSHHRAATAQLYLPPSQIPLQGLQPDPLPHSLEASSSFYTYNSSEMTPVVPLWLAWMTDAMSMLNRSHGLDEAVARQVSAYVATSYCEYENIAAWNCSRCDDDFEPERVLYDPVWDLQGFVGYSNRLNAIIVSFRGTDSHSIYNWVENMRTWRTDFALYYPGAPAGTLVHGGFFYSYNSSYLAANITAGVRDLVLKKAGSPRGRGGGSGGSWMMTNSDGSSSSSSSKENQQKSHTKCIGAASNTHIDADILKSAPTIIVAGHSLGGALATLCAMDLKLNMNLPDVRLLTFGSPRVGNYIFAKWVDEQINLHWRFTHNRDLVPSLPPSYMGFYHVPREVWVVDFILDRTLVGVCDESGEDPLCHSSVCHLGLCSSLADHLLYLSEMYSPHPDGC